MLTEAAFVCEDWGCVWEFELLKRQNPFLTMKPVFTASFHDDESFHEEAQEKASFHSQFSPNSQFSHN
jgi:hypothetical protein